MSFSPDELEYYSRQILVRDFGGQAQAKLKAAHVAVVGAGGIGAPLLLYLVGAGVGHISIYEDDQIALSNLHRQVLYHFGEVGEPKAEAARTALMRLNPNIQIDLMGRFDGGSNPKADLLVDGTDRLATRQLVNRSAQAWGVPLIAASLAQWEGQIALFDPAHHAGCYECLYSADTDASAIPSCSEAGVIGAVAGVVGTMTALEVIKFIANIKPLEAGQMRFYDGLYQELRTLKIAPRKDCPVCDKATT